jgi:hypothetical protein
VGAHTSRATVGSSVCATSRLVPVSTFQLGASTPAQYQPRGDAPEEFRRKAKSPVQGPPADAPRDQATKPTSDSEAEHTVDQTQNADEMPADRSDSVPKPEEQTAGNGNPATAQGPPQADASVTQQLEQIAYAATEARPRSPKPEADGKLDRGFKFPTSSPPPDEQATGTGEGAARDVSSVEASNVEAAPTAEMSEQHEEPSPAHEPEVTTAEPSSEPQEAESTIPADEPIHSAASETTEAQEEPRRPEPKKTDPDVDVAARQWLSGQKPVDASEESDSQPSTKVLDEVLHQKAAKADDVETENAPESNVPAEDMEVVEEADHGEPEPATEERVAETSQQTESAPVVEVEKDKGDVVEVEDDAMPESNVESGIEVQKDRGKVVPVAEDTTVDPPKTEETAPTDVGAAEEDEGAEEVNDEEDETPADSAAQTPADSPVIPDAATVGAGGGKKKKNKKKSKK